MSTATRMATTVLALAGLAISARGGEAPEKQWVWLSKQGVWGYGYQIQGGEHDGRWRIDPDTKRSPEELAPAADPYGFVAILNQHRAAAGLGPLSYDADLSAWASQNNVEQQHRGIGHHVHPNCRQNCSWNTPDAASSAEQWMNSPGHRENMLAPDVTRVGIAYGPGPYWTMNAR